MYKFALTFGIDKDGLNERYLLEEYNCIQIEIDTFDRIVGRFKSVRTYFPYIDKWAEGIDSTGVTMIPVESIENFLTIVKVCRNEDYWNLYELEALEDMLEKAVYEHKNLIIFGI